MLLGLRRDSCAVWVPASNDAFDASLKMRDLRWGLRELDEVVAAADGFLLDRVVEMPANNLSIIFRRREP